MAKRIFNVTNAQTAETAYGPIYMDGSNFLPAGAARTLTTGDHCATVKLDTAAGSVVTLPAATGSGTRFKFIVSLLATTGSHVVKVANSSDTIQGILDFVGTTGRAAFAANASADTITLNRTTTGSVNKGESFDLQDFALNVWQVSGLLTATGSPLTPFTSGV